MWQQALPLLQEAGHQVLTQLERDRSLETVVPIGCDILRDRLPSIPADLDAGRVQLLFVPCLFFGSSLYLEFSGLIVIGTGVGQSDAAARARTESVARRLKAVADPTRLAILHSLATAPSTVGELAVLFRVAQPTVSMHVKVLRQSGLVRSERRRAAASERRSQRRGDVARRTAPGCAAQDPTAAAQSGGASTTGNDRMPATVVDRTRSA